MLKRFVLLIAFMMLGALVAFGQPQDALGEDATCQPQPLEALELPLESGQLSYIARYSYEPSQQILSSTTSVFEPSLNTFFLNPRISPEGTRIISIEPNHAGERQVVTRNNVGEIEFSLILDYPMLNEVAWLSEKEYLTIFVGPQPTWDAYSIVNTATSEVRYVHPDTSEWGNAETNPLFPDELASSPIPFRVSSSGQYALFGNHLYDLESLRITELESLHSYIWSPTSERLGFFERNVDFDMPGRQSFYVYNLADQELRQMATFEVAANDVISSTGQNGWSPNEESIAVERWSQEALLPHRVEILQIPSEEITATCLTSFFQSLRVDESGKPIAANQNYPTDFSWSRDSRYLALYGQLEGETERETGSIYIYDTHSAHIYEVSPGFADIIGWMAS